MKEFDIRKIVKESIDKLIKEASTVNSGSKYILFYIEKGDSVYDGHYLDVKQFSKDSDALKYYLKDISKIYLANIEGDLNKQERYAIGIINPKDEEDYDIIYDITLYTKNGRTAEYSYSYFDGADYSFFDSTTNKISKRFIAYLTDFIGRTIADVPKGYCQSLALIKKYVEAYIRKESKVKDDFSCLVRVYNPSKAEWKEYYATLFDDYEGGKEFYFKENND